MNKAIFIRKAVDLGDLQYQIEHMNVTPQAYTIEKTIELDLQEWEFLCQDFFGYKQYIEDNQKYMYYDENGYHCLLVTCKGKSYGILIDSEGYKYARYTSVIDLGGNS